MKVFFWSDLLAGNVILLLMVVSLGCGGEVGGIVGVFCGSRVGGSLDEF